MRTSSPNSHTWRESFSSLAPLGAGDLRFNAADFFLKASTRAADSFTRLRKFAVALRFLDQLLVGTRDVLLDMADQAQVAAGAYVLHRGLLDGRRFQHASHFQIVGDDQSAIADLLAQDVGDPLFATATPDSDRA